MSYADLAAFRAFLRITDPTDTVDDVQLQGALDTATSAIDHLCSRRFEVATTTATVRYFQPWWDRRWGQWALPIDDLFDTTGLAVRTWDAGSVSWVTNVTGYALRPVNAAAQGRPYTRVLLPPGSGYAPGTGWGSNDNADYVAVTARWGWPAVPAPVVQACLLQADRVLKRRDAPFGVTSSPDGSENTRLGNTVDVDVQVALRGFIKYWAAR